jgi:hypothetical protein
LVQVPAQIETVIFFKAIRLALGPNQSVLHWVQGALALEIKQVKDEAHHCLSPSSAEVKNK